MANNNDKFVTMIGFARRSGKIVYGLDNLKHAKNVKLLAVSDTASGNLVRNMERLADINEIPLIYAVGLERIVGSNVKALGLSDGNMAKAVAEYIDGGATKYTIKYGARR